MRASADCGNLVVRSVSPRAVRFPRPHVTTVDIESLLAQDELRALLETCEQRGSIQASYLSQNYKNSEIKFYDTPQAAELDLVAGRVEYILGNMVTYFVGFMKTPAAKDFAFVGPDLKGGLLGDGNGIAVRKGDAEMLSKVNAALAAIRADGTYDRITAKYFPFKLM